MNDKNDKTTVTTTSTDDKGKAALWLLAKILFGLDLAWAVLIATFQAVVVHGAGQAAGASGFTTWAGTILAWFIGFIVAMFQGAIFLVIGTVIVIGIALVLGVGKKKDNGGTDQSGTGTDGGNTGSTN